MKEIIETASLPLRVAYHVGKYGIDTVVLGDRTGSREVRDLLKQSGMRLEIVFVDEHRSSELGRRRYLLCTPATGWEKLLPIGMRTPNQPYDDFVAVILAERYLDGSRSTRIRRTRTNR